jgi:hypothetical protein
MLAGVCVLAEDQKPGEAQPTQAPAASPAPAQPTQAPATSSAPAQPAQAPADTQMSKRPSYVRRFSIGGAVSYTPFPFLGTLDKARITVNPPVDIIANTAPVINFGGRLGYGVTAQIAFFKRFALAGNLIVRHVEYNAHLDVLTGSPPATGAVDKRVQTISDENTTARYYDLPVMVRYYGKDRQVKGWRWFGEAGGALRRVSHIETTLQTTVGSADMVTTNVAARPANNTIKGGVAGFGLQFIDPIGIRVVPEVRYTYWFQNTWDQISTVSRRNQLEVNISLTF